MMFTDGAQCTANFIFTNAADVFIGYAAHCAGTGGATETNGCDSGSLPLGTPVEIDGATQPGTLAYSSWRAMQTAGETDADTCAYNDFALVKVAGADRSEEHPSELQSLMRNSYAVFCLKQKKNSTEQSNRR